jgi:hypothetical protein
MKRLLKAIDWLISLFFSLLGATHQQGLFTREELDNYLLLDPRRKNQMPEIIRHIYICKERYQQRFSREPNQITLPQYMYDDWNGACLLFECSIAEHIFQMRVVFGPVEDSVCSFNKSSSLNS